jgi:hypothetical protein
MGRRLRPPAPTEGTSHTEAGAVAVGVSLVSSSWATHLGVCLNVLDPPNPDRGPKDTGGFTANAVPCETVMQSA